MTDATKPPVLVPVVANKADGSRTVTWPGFALPRGGVLLLSFGTQTVPTYVPSNATSVVDKNPIPPNTKYIYTLDRIGTDTIAGTFTSPAALPPTEPLLGWFPGNGGVGQDAVNQLRVIGSAPCQLFHFFNSFWGPTPNYPSIGADVSLPALAEGQRLLITVPLCGTGADGAPVPGMLLSDTLTAANLQQYFILGQKLVAAGFANAVIRLGWECNGGWYGWGNQGRSAYKLAFQAVVAIMRTVPGMEFLFEWNVSGGWAPLTSQQPNPGTPFQDALPGETWEETYLGWYPGTAYVDLLGQDTYVGEWSMGLTVPYDVSWVPCVYDALVKMAVQLGKPWTTSEYGSNFGTNVSPVVNGVTIDGDGVTSSLIAAAAVVLKGERPASAWDTEIGGWTAPTPPPPAFAHVIYNWDQNNSVTYLTTGSGSATALNSLYPKSDAAYKLAWAPS